MNLIRIIAPIAGLAASLGAASETSAGPSGDPLTADTATALIRGTVDRAVKVLEDPALQGRENRVERHRRLRAISDEVFDWARMAQRSLGVHWRGLDPEQRERFTSTFKELLASHYLGQMDRFQGEEEVQHVGTEPTKNAFVVKMKLVTPSRAWVPIDFYMGKDKRVYDVAIEGVSLSNHYRGSFDRLLVNSTFDQMMKRLERKLEVQRRMAEPGGAGSGEDDTSDG
jgi:phospholipid transport system substrate-binding protein